MTSPDDYKDHPVAEHILAEHMLAFAEYVCELEDAYRDNLSYTIPELSPIELRVIYEHSKEGRLEWNMIEDTPDILYIGGIWKLAEWWAQQPALLLSSENCPEVDGWEDLMDKYVGRPEVAYMLHLKDEGCLNKSTHLDGFPDPILSGGQGHPRHYWKLSEIIDLVETKIRKSRPVLSDRRRARQPQNTLTLDEVNGSTSSSTFP